MRIDFSVIGFVEFLCYLAIAGFFLRYMSIKFHDTSFGKALAFIYG